MKTLIVAAERGWISVQSKVDSGSVEVRTVRNMKDADDILWELKRGEIKYDVVVVDSMTKLAARVRRDITVPAQQIDNKGIWGNIDKMVTTQQDWGRMTDAIGRWFGYLLDLDIDTRFIFICQESEKEDPTEGILKKGPALNDRLLYDLYADSDVVGRLYLSGEPFSVGDVKYPKGTRILRIAPTDTVMAKIRSDLHTTGLSVPPVIVEPDLTKLRAAFGRDIKALTLYGPPGVGKTTFSCTDSK